MGGQRIDREERYERTGLTSEARKKLMVKLRSQGYTLQAIADHFGVAVSNVHYTLAAADGRPRVQVRKKFCEGCWQDVPAKEFGPTGLCRECEALT
jgi:rRNA maturation endonuclease Nob1